eukprot:c24864_g1_i1 orf=174-1148(-)
MVDGKRISKRGHWSLDEDIRLLQVVRRHGEGHWSRLAKAAGLQRCGKSCRLRWVNYLRPDVKRGHISLEEERLIIQLHEAFGNRWSLIAMHLPGRSDNEIKNYWRSHLKKKLQTVPSQSNQEDALHGCSLRSDSSCQHAHQEDRKVSVVGRGITGKTDTIASFADISGHIERQTSSSHFNFHIHHPDHISYGTSKQQETHLHSTFADVHTIINKADRWTQLPVMLDKYALGQASDVEAGYETISAASPPYHRDATAPTRIPEVNLILPDSDQIPWEVETIQSITDNQNVPSVTESCFTSELWADELFAYNTEAINGGNAVNYQL